MPIRRSLRSLVTDLLIPDSAPGVLPAVPTAVGVVIPARDEEHLTPACLTSVLKALDHVALPSVVVLVAHRCSDATERVAEQILAARGHVIIDDESADVAGARRMGVRTVLRRFGDVAPDQLWLLSTDADTIVPRDWVRRILRHSAEGATAVAGLADLSSWRALSGPSQRRYRAIVQAGINGDAHTHAYAANLAVRADAYLAVGGWPSAGAGEEHALLRALEAGGWPIRRPTDIVVATSGRLRARASGGLGDLLAGL